MSDDNISREAAIKMLLEELQYKGEYPQDNGLNQYDIESVLNALPSAEPQRWVPVGERLPDAAWGRGALATEVLVSFAWGSVGTALYSDGEWRYDIGTYADGDVVAWMPLPEPWKGEE